MPVLWERLTFKGKVNMKRQMRYRKEMCGVMICVFLLWGCTGNYDTMRTDSGNDIEEVQDVAMNADAAEEGAREAVTPQSTTAVSSQEEADGQDTESIFQETVTEPEVIEADWSGYFDGLNGAAVLYDVSASRYLLYNPELADTRRSPCSTFKIISSMLALENGMIDPEDSTHTWSGEVFWNESWNQDIAFPEAFRASCVWYFREIIDEMGPEMVQAGLDELAYGNCDISDWEGRMNTNNNNRALTGFWVESSLAISPKEQTEVMERIFGKDSVCSEETRNVLKQVMLVTEPEETIVPMYGKTGMGKAGGVVVDAWFTGFAECAQGNVYYCVYLGQTDDGDVSSAAAREIAIRIVEEYCQVYQ